MAGVESVRGDIVKAGGVEALLEFLQRRPGSPGKDSASEIMACERVQQKSTIAISRYRLWTLIDLCIVINEDQ